MPSDLPINVSSYGADIDGVITFIFWCVGIWFVAAEAILVFALVRFRRRDGVRGAWLPADTLRSSAVILAPLAGVILCDLYIEHMSSSVWRAVKNEAPPHHTLVRITGRQFVWTFQYAGKDGRLDTKDDFETVGEMHVPRGRVVRFQLESHDVLHAFWSPALRLKQDAVPGRSIPGWFEATKDGSYEIACAELCGPAHTSMRAWMIVEPPESFDAWIEMKSEQVPEVASHVAR
jgi:cytochrome c oxidase subunit 2